MKNSMSCYSMSLQWISEIISINLIQRSKSRISVYESSNARVANCTCAERAGKLLYYLIGQARWSATARLKTLLFSLTTRSICQGYLLIVCKLLLASRASDYFYLSVSYDSRARRHGPKNLTISEIVCLSLQFDLQWLLLRANNLS